MTERRKCKAKTKAGKSCRATGILDNGFCMAHQPKDEKEKLGFGGAQEGAGRPAAPRAVDVLRERLEANIDKVLDPLFNAAEATRRVWDSDTEEYVELDDHQIRIVAIRELLDRAYGKPKQATELSGEVSVNNGPDLSNLSDEELAQFEALMRKAAEA